jgi:hypothetical protein
MLTVRRRTSAIPHPGASALLDASEPPRATPLAQQQVLARAPLATILPWLIPVSAAFAILEAFVGAVANERALIAASALTTSFAVVVLAARWLAVRGRDIAGTTLVAGSVVVLGFLGTLTVPGINEAMILMPVLAVAILLPYANGRNRLSIVGLALISTALILVGDDLGNPTPMAQPLGHLFDQAILVGVVALVGLVMAALADYSDSATRSLRALDASVIEHELMSGDRVALSRVLESLEGKETVEATAQAIADGLVTLRGINVGGVLEYHDGGLRVLGVAAPHAFSLHAGDRIPAAHAESLIASSAHGPWAEPGRASEESADPGAGASIGLLVSAYAPMRSGDQFLGLVGIGTTDPRHAQHLVEDLPAVGEVAATAAALLGPTLLARRDAAAVRGRIETIIAERTFMPVFQAITTIPEREVVAYEALTRFTDGIRPDLHFANAAAAGLGVELELVTLEAAVRAAERIPRSLWRHSTAESLPRAEVSGPRHRRPYEQPGCLNVAFFSYRTAAGVA